MGGLARDDETPSQPARRGRRGRGRRRDHRPPTCGGSAVSHDRTDSRLPSGTRELPVRQARRPRASLSARRLGRAASRSAERADLREGTAVSDPALPRAHEERAAADALRRALHALLAAAEPERSHVGGAARRRREPDHQQALSRAASDRRRGGARPRALRVVPPAARSANPRRGSSPDPPDELRRRPRRPVLPGVVRRADPGDPLAGQLREAHRRREPLESRARAGSPDPVREGAVTEGIEADSGRTHLHVLRPRRNVRPPFRQVERLARRDPNLLRRMAAHTAFEATRSCSTSCATRRRSPLCARTGSDDSRTARGSRCPSRRSWTRSGTSSSRTSR